MGSIYIISVIILLVAFSFLKKTENKINFISHISISIVTLFCYNTFVCYVLTFFKIPNSLAILSGINIILASLLGIKTIKEKKIQEYSINIIDIISTILIGISVLGVSYINFGFPMNVKYESGDPEVHFLTSMMFAEGDLLLASGKTDTVYRNFIIRKTASYVNSGLLMKSLVKDLEPVACYKIFAGFGVFVLFMTGITIYSAMTNFAKKKEHRIWALIISLLCTLGYPLNSLLFGFEYLSMGLLIICAILNFIYYYEKDLISLKIFIPIMFLLNFGIFTAYYMFVPFMYPAMWIYFCIKSYHKTKKIISKEAVVLCIVTLLIPFILGYIYHLAPRFYGVIINQEQQIQEYNGYSSRLLNKSIATKGYIYINLYSNILLLLPLTIYLIIKDTKESKLNNNCYIALLLLFVFAFIEILTFGAYLNKVSFYYLSKNHYALWIILLYCNYKALIKISEKRDILPRILITIYIALLIIYTTLTNVSINQNKESLTDIMDIFCVNKTILLKNNDLNQDELEILKYARNNLNFETEIEILGNEQQCFWTYAILRYINVDEDTDAYSGDRKIQIKTIKAKEKINKVDYIIYFNRSRQYEKAKDKLFNEAEIVYENSAGGIVKYNK